MTARSRATGPKARRRDAPGGSAFGLGLPAVAPLRGTAAPPREGPTAAPPPIRTPAAPAPSVGTSAAPPRTAVSAPAVSRMGSLLEETGALDLAARHGRILPHLDEALASLFGVERWREHLERSGSACVGRTADGRLLHDLAPRTTRLVPAGGPPGVRIAYAGAPALRPPGPRAALAALHGPLPPIRRLGSPAALFGRREGGDLTGPESPFAEGEEVVTSGVFEPPSGGPRGDDLPGLCAQRSSMSSPSRRATLAWSSAPSASHAPECGSASPISPTTCAASSGSKEN